MDWRPILAMLGPASAIVAIFGALMAGIWALVQARQNLRWRQADRAKILIDELHRDEIAKQALQILDGVRDRIQLYSEKPLPTRRDELLDTLLKRESKFHSEVALRHELLDALFFHMDRIGRSVRNGLVRFEDVEGALGYYVLLLRERRRDVEQYVTDARFWDTTPFLRAFAEWDAGEESSSGRRGFERWRNGQMPVCVLPWYLMGADSSAKRPRKQWAECAPPVRPAVDNGVDSGASVATRADGADRAANSDDCRTP